MDGRVEEFALKRGVSMEMTVAAMRRLAPGDAVVFWLSEDDAKIIAQRVAPPPNPRAHPLFSSTLYQLIVISNVDDALLCLTMRGELAEVDYGTVLRFYISNSMKIWMVVWRVQ